VFITSYPEKFHSMPQTWHSGLCKLLSQFSEGTAAVKNKVSCLELIPLIGGQWISSSQQDLYFSDEKKKDVQIPNGLEMKEIDFVAASDLSRRNLYMLLGARMWTNEKVCQAITSTHASRSFRPQKLPPKDLISHIMFLFHANWTRVKAKSLWLVTESGTAKASFDAYIDSDKSVSASILFGKDRKLFPFIHSDYLAVPPDMQPKLRAWMVANLGVADIPRMVSYNDSEPELSEDFQFLLSHADYLPVLLLLRDNWDHYAKWISEEKKSARECARQVKEAIGNLSVSCKGGISAMLKKTLLPTPNMEASSLVSMSFLEIPEPEHPQWRQLRHFGVLVTPGIGPFIKYLEILKESGGTSKEASELYKQLHTQCNLDPTLIP
jgi:hypothetical protein